MMVRFHHIIWTQWASVLLRKKHKIFFLWETVCSLTVANTFNHSTSLKYARQNLFLRTRFHFWKCKQIQQTRYNVLRLKHSKCSKTRKGLRYVKQACCSAKQVENASAFHTFHFNTNILALVGFSLNWPPFVVSTVVLVAFHPGRIPFISNLCVTALCWGFASLGAFRLWRLADGVGGRRRSLWRSTSKTDQS